MLCLIPGAGKALEVEVRHRLYPHCLQFGGRADVEEELILIRPVSGTLEPSQVERQSVV